MNVFIILRPLIYPNLQTLKRFQNSGLKLSLFHSLLYHIDPHVKSDESSHILELLSTLP